MALHSVDLLEHNQQYAAALSRAAGSAYARVRELYDKKEGDGFKKVLHKAALPKLPEGKSAVLYEKKIDFGNYLDHISKAVQERLRLIIERLTSLKSSFEKNKRGEALGTDGLISPNKITVSSSLVDGHPLQAFIEKDKPLSAADFSSFFNSEFSSIRLDNIKISADKERAVIFASNGATHQSVWTRDLAAIGLAKFDMGEYAMAKRIARALYEGYNLDEMRAKLDQFMSDNRGHNRDLWNSMESVRNLPHIKWDFDPDEVKLKPYSDPQGWSMQQIDALGYFLQLLIKLQINNDIDIKKWDAELGVSSDSHKQSTIVQLTRFLRNIEYWDQTDAGAWESGHDVADRRASSIAPCLTALKLIKGYCERKNLADENSDQDSLFEISGVNYSKERFLWDLDTAIQNGEAALFGGKIKTNEEYSPYMNAKKDQAYESRIPVSEEDADSKARSKFVQESEVKEFDRRPMDAALLFILSINDPIDLGLSREQQKAILKQVYKLMGQIAVKRYEKDRYMGENWIYNPICDSFNRKGEESNETVSDYHEAEWCLFDPYLAVANYNLFLESKGKDVESFLRADMHVRRTFAQINKANTKHTRRNLADGKEDWKDIPAGDVLESYWLDSTNSDDKVWRVGENSDFNWAKIALQLMLVKGANASRLFEKMYPNGWHQEDNEILKVAT